MRPSFSMYLMQVAEASAMRATCPKRMVGAAVANDRSIIVATGYNGPPRGLPHCTEHPCGAENTAAPESYTLCLAAHAELNALLAAGKEAVNGTIAVTVAPCRECAKAIVNAGIATVVIRERHRLFDVGLWSAERIILEAGLIIEYV